MISGRLIVAAAFLAPLATFLLQFSPRYDLQAGWDGWPAHVCVAALYAALGAWVAQTDRWLGAAVMLLGAHLLLLHGDLLSLILVALGAAALTFVRSLPLRERQVAVVVLAAAGLLQALYVLQQTAGYDIPWEVWGVGRLPAHGTLGNRDKVGAFLAITAPLMPRWALPIVIAATLATSSWGALLGLTVGLVVRYWGTWTASAVVAGIAVGGVWLAQSGKDLTSFWGRVEIWATGLRDLRGTDLVWGHGLGGWGLRIPRLQTSPVGSGLWLQAHNEPLQWLYETGVSGSAVAAAWIWHHRRALQTTAAGGGLAALAVVCLTYFPFHTPTVALVALVVLGLATPFPEAEPTAEGV